MKGIRQSPGSGVSRRPPRQVEVVCPAFLAGAACPCFELPVSRRDAARARSVARAMPQYSRRQKAAMARRAAALSGVPRAPRACQRSVAPLPLPVCRATKRRSPKRAPFWDTTAFEAAWAYSDWQLTERKLAAQRFSGNLPELAAVCARSRSHTAQPRVSMMPPAEVPRSHQALRRTERNFMRAHHGQGRVKTVEGVPPPKPTRAQRFKRKVAASLPSCSRGACDDLPRYAARSRRG